MQREATGAVADEWSVHSSPQRDALRDVPAQVRAHGLRSAHPRPLVSFGKQAGGQFNSFRVPPERAWQYPEVEYGNAGSSVAALVLDCDNPNARAEGLFNLPPPNWIVWRLENGHVHVCWTLAIPVHRYPEAHLEPLRYLAYIAEYFAYAVGADPGYAGVLAHNPVLTRWTPYETVWGWKESRTLHQYAEVIPFGWKPPKVRQTSVGRNVDLSEAGMQWAGREANAALPVLPALMLLNQNFTPPLPPSEVEAAAKSIEKYRKRWAAHGWHCPRWLAKQAARGRASGRARFEGSNEQRKPWESEGVSRRTWYRRRAT